ncbi:hypothetical protein ACFLRB_02490 [Acidobacteriota bacterium]
MAKDGDYPFRVHVKNAFEVEGASIKVTRHFYSTAFPPRTAHPRMYRRIIILSPAIASLFPFFGKKNTLR